MVARLRRPPVAWAGGAATVVVAIVVIGLVLGRVEEAGSAMHWDLELEAGALRARQFEAPDPRLYSHIITATIRPDVAVSIHVTTADGTRIEAIDGDIRSGSCRAADGVRRCLVRYPTLEARLGGTWSVDVANRSSVDARVDLRIEFERAD